MISCAISSFEIGICSDSTLIDASGPSSGADELTTGLETLAFEVVVQPVLDRIFVMLQTAVYV